MEARKTNQDTLRDPQGDQHLEFQSEASFPRMHVSLYVKDIERTVHFYSKFFGQEPSKVKDKYAKFELNRPSLIISFIEGKASASNFGHLGFQVESKEELNDLLKLARGNKLVEKEEIGTACCYAIQDKFWVSDPDGYHWEVYYFHQDAEFNDPRLEDESGAACCEPSVKSKAEASCC